MKKAAGYFVGKHDFKSFCSAGNQTDTTVREIYALEVSQEGADIVIRIQGGGFLYNMVRIIAGTLLDVGTGRKKAEEIPCIIHSLRRENAGPTAPAHGLTLIGYNLDDIL